jgi:HEXXH motif-containing protein
VGEYGRALLQIALERCGELLDAVAPSLRARLAGLLARPLPWSATWDPALAALERRLAHSPTAEQAWDGVVPMLVNLGVAGALSEADLRLHTPQALWWDGVRLPAADRLAFRRSTKGVHVEFWRRGRRLGRDFLSQSAQGVWNTGAVASAPILWLGGHPVIVRLAHRGGDPYPLPAGQRVMSRVPAYTDATFADVTRLLRGVRPSLLPWVANAIRIVVPVRSDDDARISATIEEFPGLTFLSLALEPADIAVRLVHEASHHYFLALQRLAALHDGSDTTSYHSPIKERGRTIDMILFAFHAFGNGALFHRELARRDSCFERIAGGTVSEAMAPLRTMHNYLLRTPALTSAGRTLWQPVAERLFQ